MTDSRLYLSKNLTTFSLLRAAMNQKLNENTVLPPPCGQDTPPERTSQRDSVMVNAIKESKGLRQRVLSLRADPAKTHLHWVEMGRILVHTLHFVDAQIGLLGSAGFPASRKIRQLAHTLQDLLLNLAEELGGNANEAELQHPSPELRLGGALQALSRHLLISSLIASPPARGVWLSFHQYYAMAQTLKLSEQALDDDNYRLKHLYYTTALLGCTPPCAFTPQEIAFITTYLKRFAEQIDVDDTPPLNSPAAFWIDPSQDAPAMASARKPPPPDSHLLYFCCDRIATLLSRQLDSLNSGAPAAQIGLPDFASSSAGHGTLRRLITCWGTPGKRRFPRRRQNYRAELCSGLDNLWLVLHATPPRVVEVSSWMVINESPDGYALMHVAGDPGTIAVGDVTAIRTESGERWQACIVRWAISENQEHLEIGLQILSASAFPAIVSRRPHSGEIIQFPAVILPELPPLRTTSILLAPPDVLPAAAEPLVLVIEKENLEIREVKNTRLDEQNSRINIFAIETDSTLPV